MGCKSIEAPEMPEVDTSKLSGVSLPDGVSMGDVKAKVQNPGFSDKLKGATGLISDNLKSMSKGLTPAAIGDKIKGAITGLADGIKNTVTGAVDSIKSLAGNLKGFSPGKFKINSPAGAFDSVKGKMTSKFEAIGNRQAARTSKLCGDKFCKEAGGVNNSIN